MAIMVAGGLTFAIPGMEPAHAAMIPSNPNLRVSAEGQNADNEIGATNIVQVVILDDLIGDVGDAPPILAIDGNPVQPYQSGTGAWYAYFADDDIATTGLPGAAFCLNTDTTNDLEDVKDVCPEVLNVDDDTTNTDLVKTAPTKAVLEGTTVQGGDPTLYLFDLSENFDVVYDSPAGTQVVSMEYDDPASSVSLDRSSYPQNTDVEITLDHQALNVDPDDRGYMGL